MSEELKKPHTITEIWACANCRKGKHQHLDSKCPFESTTYLPMTADDMHKFVDEHLQEALAWLTQA